MNADCTDPHDQAACDAPVDIRASINPPLPIGTSNGRSEMSYRKQSLMVDSLGCASSGLVEAEHSERDVWMHEFRNALGTIVVAAGATRSLLTDLGETEISIAIGRIEDGCNRCLRLFRTMPPF